MIDVDVALPAPVLSSASVALPAERVPLETFANAEQEAAIGGSGDQIAVQHEPDPAKHLHFANRACAREGKPNRVLHRLCCNI